MTYTYSDRQLREWSELPKSTYLWDLNKHLETQIEYWRKRATSAERRMTEHECEEQ